MALMTRGDLPFLAYSAATVALRVIPKGLRRSRLMPVSRWLGRAWFALDRGTAARSRRNMQMVMGERMTPAEIEAALREHFYVIALGKMINDMLPEMTLAELEQFLRLEGAENLQAAMEPGKGLLLLGAHYGLHGYVPNTLYQRLGYPFETVLGEEFPVDSRVYRKFVHPVRSRNWNALPVIPTTGNPQRRMLQCLREGKSLLIWPDLVDADLFRLPEPHVIRLPFLGRTMLFRTGSFQLAQWTQVTTLPFFTIPRPDGGFAMRVEPALTIHLEKSMEALRATVAGYVARLEQHVLEHPGLWWQWRQARLLEMMELERIAG